MKDTGQIIIILLLVMVVALAIGLSVVGRSINDISTSTNTENSSRAFSAAEAGIEKILNLQYEQAISLGGKVTPLSDIQFDNNASAKDVLIDAAIPREKTALEYPPFGKESFAQFWLASPADPNCTDPVGSRCYREDNFDVYFGEAREYSSRLDNLEDQPAIEVSVIYKIGGEYKSEKYFFDSYVKAPLPGRNSNNFNGCLDRGDSATAWSVPKIVTNGGISANRAFYCKVNISGYKETGSEIPYMVRVRILYTNSSHPVAVAPTGNASLPLQTNIYKSTGVAGDVQRRFEVFREKSVMPQFFDFALFSAGSLNKE